jgi:hypothetical protein
MRRAGWAPSALSALVLAVALGGCGSSGDDEASLLPAPQGLSLQGNEFEVMLPSGQFTFTATDTRREVTEDEAADGESHEAPDGQHYLGLNWVWEGSSPAFAKLNRDQPPQVATVSVVAGEREVSVFELDTQATGSGDPAWVLVPDDAEARLHVTYDGHTQTVDLASGEVDAGVAEGFYELGDTGYGADCPDQGPGTASGRDGWQYQIRGGVGEVFPVPYVAGLGWASPGQTWLLTPVELAAWEFGFAAGDESTSYRVDRHKDSISVAGGGDPEELWQRGETPGGSLTTYAVPVPADGPWKLDITRTYDLTRSGVAPGAPATHQIRYHCTVTLGS